MTRWKPCEYGWYYCHPTDAGLEHAREHAGTQVEGTYDAGRELIFLGRLSEVGLRLFFVERFMECDLNGGYDGSPDLILRGLGCAVKCRSLNMGNFRPTYVVNVPADDLERRVQDEEYLFCCYETRKNRLLFLGGCSRQHFRERATYVRAGSELNPVTAAGEETYSIEARELTPPMEWLWLRHGAVDPN